MAMVFVLISTIRRSLSRTLLSRHNVKHGTSSNLCRTTFDRVPHLSMILLSFLACLTSMFAAMSDSVEMIKFVTCATCHVTTNGSPFSSRSQFVLYQCIPRCFQWRCSKLAGWLVLAVMEDRWRNSLDKMSRLIQNPA